MTLIKICGVKTEEEALFAAKCGAHFIGIVMHKGSKRYVPPIRAHTIANSIREGGATPVAVFLDESREEIIEAVEVAGITTIQTYRDVELPDLYTIIYANPESKKVDGSDEVFLFDGPAPGSGQQLSTRYLPSPLPRKFFIAGGITPNNVRSFIETYQPTGVDVSSGVETNGTKDQKKIQTFINKVREYDKTIR